ncbi:MAG: hypothetical protein JWM69_1319 [Candidatus Binatus sp.]|nr:hypothetical protein [Candidatus Binatus sp.]
MMSIRARGTWAIVDALMIAGLILVLPSRGRSQVSAGSEIAASDAQAAIPPQSESASTGGTSQTANKTLRQRVTSMVEKLTPERIKRNREFKVASTTFPDFCKHWEQNLRDRERYNLAKLNFSEKEGFETATYTGYGKILGCEAHQSKDGYSIGKLSYEEFIYYIVGKTKEEARSGAPKAISDLHTIEIFRWENKKWFY